MIPFNCPFRKISRTLVAVTTSLVVAASWSAARLSASSAIATVGQQVVFSVSANGTAPFTYQWYKDGLALPQSNSSQYTIDSVSPAHAGNYTARVSNSAGSVASDVASLLVNQAVVAPSFQSQPSALTLQAGALGSMSVSVVGSAPLTYQWMKNGVNISGANSATLSFLAAVLGDAGSYSVKVSNAAGSVTSNSASLTVSLITPVPTPVPVSPPASGAPFITDSSFESVNVGSNNFYAFAYTPIVSGWTFKADAGLAGNNSGFTSGNQSAPSGNQVAFVQCQGSISTQVSFSAGTYTLSATVANRMNWGTWQTVNVYIDSNLVGRFTGTNTYAVVTSSPFTVTAGPHTISFVGQSGPDATLFLDNIILNATASAPTGVTLGNGGFEAPDVGSNNFNAFQYQPQRVAGIQDWTFQGDSGVAANNSGFTSGNPAAPEGKQVAFVQTIAVVSQAISFPSSTNYKVSGLAAQRQNWGQGAQTVQVYIDSNYVGSISPSGGSFQAFSLPFSVSAGTHTLSFRGTTTWDCTVFLDQIVIQ